jgi:hypothetical protein
MKYRRFAGLLSIFLLGYLGHAAGQGCALNMEPHYNTYATVSADSGHIYTSVLTSGYANFIPSAACSGQGATHKPYAYNKLGAAGGWGSGTGGCINCYLSYTNNQAIATAPNTIYLFSFQGEIVCSLAGTFWVTTVTENNVIPPQGACGTITVVGNHLSPSVCDNGRTTLHDTINISRKTGAAIDSYLATPSTDNVLLIDLIGSPYSAPICPAGDICRTQDLKLYKYTTHPTGNVNWDLKIWCQVTTNPDIHASLRQPVSCQ